MDCPYIPSVGLSQFTDRIGPAVDRQRIPIAGSLETNFRCNLRCRHCYVAHGHTGIPGRQELSLAEIRRILGEVADAGTLWLLLTGGEPLLRPDFADIYRGIKRKGFLVTLFTNGTLVTPRTADLLAEWRPFNLEITLYGASQATYEQVTGVPGSYARCRRGIELLMERGLPLRLKTVLMTLNQHEFEEMQGFAEGLGLRFRYDPMVNAGLDGSRGPLDLRLPPQRIVQIERSNEDVRKDWERLRDVYRDYRPNVRHMYSCGAGLRSFHIDPYGQLSLCMMSRQENYDLRQGSFREGWGDHLYRVRHQPSRQEYGCSQCKLMIVCGQCPGWSALEHGEPQKKVHYLCQVAHERAQAYEWLST